MKKFIERRTGLTTLFLIISLYILSPEYALSCPSCPANSSNMSQGGTYNASGNQVPGLPGCRCNTGFALNNGACVSSCIPNNSIIGSGGQCGATAGVFTYSGALNGQVCCSGVYRQVCQVPWDSADYLCGDGSTSCPAGPVTWNTNCGATLATEGPNNQPRNNVANTNPGYTGTANFRCTNGTWVLQAGATCVVADTCATPGTCFFFEDGDTGQGCSPSIDTCQALNGRTGCTQNGNRTTQCCDLRRKEYTCRRP